MGVSQVSNFSWFCQVWKPETFCQNLIAISRERERESERERDEGSWISPFVFLSFFLYYSDLFYLLTVGEKIIIAPDLTHTHDGNPLDKRSASSQRLQPDNNNSYKRQTSMHRLDLNPQPQQAMRKCFYHLNRAATRHRCQHAVCLKIMYAATNLHLNSWRPVKKFRS